ncbi:glycosyltransferase [bacterium]|jgi:glycosyltransferase involved in cell wall biosynthesis|nr:glycosyltransferase [bacterium]
MNKDFSISVIIPVLNEEHHISPCLDSILSQTRRHIEVIVVDNGSTDGTAKIVERFSNRDGRVRLVKEGRKGVVYARNRGIEEACGDFIAFTDADCVAVVSWLGSLVRHFDESGIASVRGPNVLPREDTNTGNIIKETFTFFLPFGRKYCDFGHSSRQVDFNPSCNVMYRKEALRKTGLFSPDMYPLEDEEMAARLRKTGYQVLCDPDAIVYHYKKTEISDVFKLAYRFGKSRASFLKKGSEPGIFRWSAIAVSFNVVILALICLLFSPKTVFMSLTLLSLILALLIGLSLMIARKTKIMDFPVYFFFVLLIVTGWNTGFIVKLFAPNRKS